MGKARGESSALLIAQNGAGFWALGWVGFGSRALPVGRGLAPLTLCPIYRYLSKMPAPHLSYGDTRRLLSSVRSEILALGVERLALFGSVRRDEATAVSDVDFLVEFRSGEKTFDRFLALVELLERVVGRPVELVTTESLSPYIGPHILAEANDVVRAA